MSSFAVGVLQVTSTRYATDHPAWLHQVARLNEDLRQLTKGAGSDDGGLVLRVEPERPKSPDTVTKGLVEISGVVLASATVIKAAAVVIREWAKLDAGRSVSLKFERGGSDVELDGKGKRGVEAALELLRAELGSDVEDEPRDGGE